MASAGVELLAGLDDLAVMGFAEVFSRLPFFLKLERRLVRTLTSEGVDLVIPIDYPGLNLRVSEKAAKLGVPVLFYIAPQVWAWKARRAGRLARAADRIAVILPFEAEIFRAEGGRAEFVGHPLLDREEAVASRPDFCGETGLDPDRPILAVFPGSRAQEIRRHLKPFLGAAERLMGELPPLQVVVARAPDVVLGPERIPEGVRVTTDGRALLHHARAALVKSGTTTLEAALAGVPFVVAYRTHPITYRLARRLVKVDHVALSNLVVGRRVVPELIQDEATPEALAAALLPLLTETEQRKRMLEGIGEVRAALGEAGAARRVAEMAAEVLEERRASASHGAERP